MDIQVIANGVVNTIAPYLPSLLVLGGTMGEEMAKKISENVGDDAWELAKKLWFKITNGDDEKVENTIKKAKVVADNPDEEVFITVLEKVLVEQLQADNKLQEELRKIISNNQDIFQNMTINNSHSDKVNQRSKKPIGQTLKVTNSTIKEINQEQ